MSMTSMNVSLPEELKDYVEAQIKHGYSTPSEYVRELIREDQKRRAREQLDSLLLAGLNSGDPMPVDAKFWSDLKHEALAKLQASKKTTKLQAKKTTSKK
jgi:antitoxin ParD1/3/4